MFSLAKYCCAAIAALALGVALTATASAQTVGNGKFAFVNEAIIYTINADGTGLAQLTSKGSERTVDRQPAWSPDGAKIAFGRGTVPSGTPDIYVMNSDGSAPVRLTDDPADDSQPTWSPDGTRIAFTSNRNGNNEIYVMNADGSNVVNLTNNAELDFFPAWSPDGNRIAFVSRRDFAGQTGGGISGGFEIYVMNADGSAPARLTNNTSQDIGPRWSPDGLKIVFASQRDGLPVVYTMNADGSNQINVRGTTTLDSSNPVWSPDGAKIAFVSFGAGNFSNTLEIFTMNTDGTNVVRVTDSPYHELEIAWQPLPNSPQPTPTPVPTPAPAPAGTISGHVADASGNPIADVTILIEGFETGTHTVQTDASGNYSFSYAPDTRIRVTPSQSGIIFNPQSRSFVSTGLLSGDFTADFTRVPPPVVAILQFSSPTFVASESAGFADITVTRTGDVGGEARVEYFTLDGTARGSAEANADYIREQNLLNFASGETSKTFRIRITDDHFGEGNETVRLRLINESGGVVLNPNQAMLTILDDDVPASTASRIDDPGFFVNQHYTDFLNRQPDTSGYDFWVNQLASCGGDAQCTQVKRINVSAAYFLSVEFQQTGYLAYRFYQAGFGRRPFLAEFLPDTQLLGNRVVVESEGWQQQLETNKETLANIFVQRAAFRNLYGSLSNEQYVDALIANTGVVFPSAERDALVSGLNNNAGTRATVLRRVAENEAFYRKELNPAFVTMQYFGYLRRDPDTAGYNFWLGKLNEFGGNFVDAEMVKAFINSGEYRARFGQ